VIYSQPNGNYLDNAICSWTIDCGTGQAQPLPPVVTITDMDLESDYEYARSGLLYLLPHH